MHRQSARVILAYSVPLTLVILALGAAIRQEQLSDTALTAFAAILGAVVGNVLGRDTEKKHDDPDL